jgi:putative membrane protein
MHIGKSYSFSEFLVWTRRDLYVLIVVSLVAVTLYDTMGLKWLGIPWTVVALLGTATAFIVGFKNVQTYNRTWEARQVWADIVSASRAWGAMSRDFFNNPGKSKELIYRHLAWLTALRYQMREARAWETAGDAQNAEFLRFYSAPERGASLETELAKYLSDEELKQVLLTGSKPARLLGLQSSAIKALFASQEIVVLQFVDMQRALREFFLQQGRSERIKEFPYPRQFAVISSMFVKLFCLLLPFGLLREFEGLNDGVQGLMKGNMTLLVIPFSTLISWMYTSLDRVGESTENPFEGNANDIPISQMCRAVEVDLRAMLGETDLPPLLQPRNNIIL